MAIRLNEIALKHEDNPYALRKKAEALGFQIKKPSQSLDKITAEALELAVYGKAIAVRFDTRPPSESNLIPSGAGGRLVHLRHLMSLVRTLFSNIGAAQEVELKAKELAHLLAIAKHKDRANPQPLEWQEAEMLIGELARSGVAIQVEEIPPIQVAKHPQAPPKPAKKSQGVGLPQKKKRKKARKKRKTQPKPKLIYTAFETSRRRH